ncbi:type II toxin-antitoxin system VapC family toxin [Streptomyces sp. NPDC051109]|uniref:type II toxin-antitoxin system VapC family toxin n=1 Tax=Streptomyces sp. NPDC051109 TaxID=3365642 RepID=UPI0037A01389
MTQQYLLDSGPLAAYLLGRRYSVSAIAPWVVQGEAVTSILVYGEVAEYFKEMNNHDVLHQQLRKLLQVAPPLALTYDILDRFADLRRALRHPYGAVLVGDMDTLIAATALEYGIPVVTSNVKHFARIPGLDVIDFDQYEESAA